MQVLEGGHEVRGLAVPPGRVDHEVLALIFAPGLSAGERAALLARGVDAGGDDEDGDESASPAEPRRPTDAGERRRSGQGLHPLWCTAALHNRPGRVGSIGLVRNRSAIHRIIPLEPGASLAVAGSAIRHHSLRFEPYCIAMTSISTSAASFGSTAWTVLRAGGTPEKNFAYTSFIAWKSEMFLRNTVTLTARSMLVPA